ncbi:hypothetical protein [Streptosporangium canum]
MNNQTDGDIKLYADPFCMIPLVPFDTVKPGHGTHVSAIGSFSAT